MKKSPKEIKAEIDSNINDLIKKIGIISYFNSDAQKINLFITGNNYFIEQANLDLADLNTAKKNNDKIVYAWRTNDVFNDKIYEVHLNELQLLLELKYKEAIAATGFKIQAKFKITGQTKEEYEIYVKDLFKKHFKEAIVPIGFKTKAGFAKYEVAEIELRFSKYFDWFPILKQWYDFLKTESIKKDSEDSILTKKLILTPDLKSFFIPETTNEMIEAMKVFFYTKPQELAITILALQDMSYFNQGFNQLKFIDALSKECNLRIIRQSFNGAYNDLKNNPPKYKMDKIRARKSDINKALNGIKK